ncbi:hypothetical protein SGLAM104S_10041 [Streptomyces glaucescens]
MATRCQIAEPVNPMTVSTPRAAAARAVSFIRAAARCRTPSGSPSPHTSGGRIAWWRSSMMASQTAWPTRWLETAQHFRPYLSSSWCREATYDGSASALSTSKWSPQQASSRPS